MKPRTQNRRSVVKLWLATCAHSPTLDDSRLSLRMPPQTMRSLYRGRGALQLVFVDRDTGLQQPLQGKDALRSRSIIQVGRPSSPWVPIVRWRRAVGPAANGGSCREELRNNYIFTDGGFAITSCRPVMPERKWMLTSAVHVLSVLSFGAI